MQLADILKLKGFNHKKIKVIRHTTNRKEIKVLVDLGEFELYQSYQKTEVFKDAEYIISFRATEGRKAVLQGVYKVNKVQQVMNLPDILHPIIDLENWGPGPYFHYDLIRENSLADLEERLVIDWGGSTVTWCQKRLDKDIIEILPEGYAKTFLGYENVLLDFDELEKIVMHPDVNKQWKMMLSNVYGVYLILDTTTGQQYIGSAYGKEGLWGRWSNYIQSKHGGNKILIELLKDDPLRYKKFRFSILNVVPNSSLKEEVIHLEQITKEKLGTRVFGLNSN
ncbi:GIY-YIG nuclease family protein [Proteinivorax hydrogeniformans]|uniref:GIY-YIG nuclease family protein n=1 Tax=Proteinivorax hydrogeniformans TaxID=1826727 RepID=A0AAU8HUJ9_9FIRM